ncbi:MAG: CHRD domain-containing protein [Chthonomonas sp.]|nr:CHRD domain-containing protein [Chthonomonas sp.]
MSTPIMKPAVVELSEADPSENSTQRCGFLTIAHYNADGEGIGSLSDMRFFKVFLFFGVVQVAGLAQANLYFFTGTLRGATVVPANSSTGTGHVFIVVDTSIHTMRIRLNFAGLAGNTTGAQIHDSNGNATNGLAATEAPSFSGFPLGVQSGSMDMTYSLAQSSTYNPAFIAASGGTTFRAYHQLLGRMLAYRAYFNVRSSAFTGGELRANLAPVPEPGMFSAWIAGAALLLCRRRKGT